MICFGFIFVKSRHPNRSLWDPSRTSVSSVSDAE